MKNVEISLGHSQVIAYNPSNGKIYVTSGDRLDIVDPLKEIYIKNISLAYLSSGLVWPIILVMAKYMF